MDEILVEINQHAHQLNIQATKASQLRDEFAKHESHLKSQAIELHAFGSRVEDVINKQVQRAYKQAHDEYVELQAELKKENETLKQKLQKLQNDFQNQNNPIITEMQEELNKKSKVIQELWSDLKNFV